MLYQLSSQLFVWWELKCELIWEEVFPQLALNSYIYLAHGDMAWLNNTLIIPLEGSPSLAEIQVYTHAFPFHAWTIYNSNVGTYCTWISPKTFSYASLVSN